MNFKTLISEDNESISLGRLTFLLLTLVLFLFWLSPIIMIFFKEFNKENIEMIKIMLTVPDGLIAAWTTSLMYNLGKKLPIMNKKEINK